MGRRNLVASMGAAAILAAIAIPATESGAAGVPVEHVSTTGTDTGNCVSAPCATINYAISVAPAGQTIRVAAGSYNQTVDVNKPVQIIGAGATTTTLDGSGQDPSGNGYFGIVYFGNVGGLASIQGFTITNPVVYSYSGEPEAIVLYQDQNATDQIDIANNIITEGTADTSAGTEFPIGIDTFYDAARVNISHNQISGFFQGLLAEDQGPVNFSHNTVSGLITGTDNSTTPATVYPGEGAFFLADEGGTYTGQNASSNSFSGYSGYGIAEDAGYSGGYVTPGCIANGSISSSLTGNTFALTGGYAADGIALRGDGTGNNLSVTLKSNKGYVTSPSNAIDTESISPTPTGNTNCGAYSEIVAGGASLSAVEDNNNIATHAATSASTAHPAQAAGFHVPDFRAG